jgi:hypothetical protein
MEIHPNAATFNALLVGLSSSKNDELMTQINNEMKKFYLENFKGRES